MDEKSIRTYFEADHDRLDDLFRKFQKLKRSDFPAAKDCFREFNMGLQRHIVWEEEILFPLFERKTGITEGGPTQVMRMEHRQIRGYLESIHGKVKEKNPDTDQEEQLLLSVLSLHNQKEENILYPAIDRVVSDEEKMSVFAAMEKLAEKSDRVCCRDA